MRLLALTLALAGALMLAAPARAAGLTLCNQTSYVLYAAAAAVKAGTAATQGWTRVVPGACQAALDAPLDPDATYYLYARSSQAHAGPPRAWGGQTPFCVEDANFSLKNPAGTGLCRQSDAFAVPFAALQTGGKRSWTTTLTESKKIGTLAFAQTAGIYRLLMDAGYKLGDGPGHIGVVAALEKFRTRMKLPANAPSADIFDALETEALKQTAPQGYSVCNDTEQEIYAAIGQNTGKDWWAHGWWDVAPGACAHVLTQPVARQKIYLLVEHRGKDARAIVSGPAKFCITDIAFDIQGRGNCVKRGLQEAGFAETNGKGLAGFAAHVGESGLLPAAPVVE